MNPADGLPVPQRYWAVSAIAIALTMAVLDSAIANVALPTIAKELDIRPAESIWIVNAYQLAITVSLFPLASLGDIFGYRRGFLGGGGGFSPAARGGAPSGALFSPPPG